MTEREPVPLRDALAGVGRELGMPSPAQLSALLDAWPEVVGTDLARHTSVRSVRDGVLVVATAEPAVAAQFRYLETDVCAAARRLVGPGVVRSVRVVVTGRARPSEPGRFW
jgi:predicted nucleic acid-binding Zn ribbon protein